MTINQARILVVEKDPDIAKMLRIYFEAKGHEVFATETYDETLHLCRLKAPEIVVLGTHLPDDDEFAERLQKAGLAQSISILHYEEEHEQRPTKFSRPFDIDKLGQLVQTVMANHSK